MASATTRDGLVADKAEDDGAEAKVAHAEHTQQECNGDRPEVQQCSVCGKLGHVAGDECCPLRDLHRSPDGYGERDEDVHQQRSTGRGRSTSRTTTAKGRGRHHREHERGRKKRRSSNMDTDVDMPMLQDSEDEVDVSAEETSTPGSSTLEVERPISDVDVQENHDDMSCVEGEFTSQQAAHIHGYGMGLREGRRLQARQS